MRQSLASLASLVFVSASLLAVADGRAADLIEPYADEARSCDSCSDAERPWVEDERDADQAARWWRGYRLGLAEGTRRRWVDPCACGPSAGYAGYPVPAAPSYAYWYAYAYGPAY